LKKCQIKLITFINPKEKEEKMNVIKKLLIDESGASAVEYALMVAVIAVTLLGGVTAYYQSLTNKMKSNATTIGAGS
jgi:Flp pilus assembly pilin Flp